MSGKTPGAGRKPLLTDVQELWVGARCEELWQQAWRAKVDATIAGIGLHARTQPDTDQAEDNWYALRERQGIRADDPKEPIPEIQIDEPKPQGVQDKIRAQVQREVRARYGKEIPRSKIQKYWKSYRAS